MQSALVDAALDRLSRVFHSEANFQQALAMALQRQFHSLTVRAEYPVHNSPVDLWLADENATMVVELNYPKKLFEAQTADETFAFGNTPTGLSRLDAAIRARR